MQCNFKNCRANCKKIGDSVEILKAVGEPNRLRILCVLSEGATSVGEISKRLHLEHNLVSFHLKNLLEVGILAREREGNRSIYSVKKGKEKSVQSFLELSR